MACIYGFNTLHIFDENAVLQIINERTEGIGEHKDKIKEAMEGLDQQLINCTKDINDKIDQVIAVVEEKRKLLLSRMTDCINNKKTELERKLNKIIEIDTIQNKVTEECKTILSNKSYSSPLKSIKMNDIITKYKNDMSLLNIKKNQFPIEKVYNERLITGSFTIPKISDIFGYYFNVKWNQRYAGKPFYNLLKPQNIDMTHAQRQLIIHYWFHKCLNIQCIADIYVLINEYLKFYDQWDPKSMSPLNYNMFDNGLTVHKTGYSETAAVGSLIAKSGSKYHWKFNIVKYSTYMMFGVIDNSKIGPGPRVPRSWWLKEYGYAYSNGGYFYHDKICESYGYGVTDNDIIDIWLDLKEYKISFAHNNKIIGTGYKVKENIDYRMVIGTANAPLLIKLI